MTIRSAHHRTDPTTGRRIPVRAHRVTTRPSTPPVALTPEGATLALGTVAGDPMAQGRTSEAAAAFADPAVRLWPPTAPVTERWVVQAKDQTVLVSTHRDNPDGDGLIEHLAVGTIVPAGPRWGYPADTADTWIMWDHETNLVPLGGTGIVTLDQRDGEATPFTTVDEVLAAVTTEATAAAE